MKTTHYPNKIRSHLVTIAPMFTPKSTSKLRSALHSRYRGGLYRYSLGGLVIAAKILALVRSPGHT